MFAFAQGWSQRAAVRTLTPERERELELQMQMPSPKGRQVTSRGTIKHPLKSVPNVPNVI